LLSSFLIFSLILWCSVQPFYSFLQITKHWSNNEKAEMSFEKLQLIATTVASSLHKVRWLKHRNSGLHICEALHFPAKGFTDKELEAWLNRASFWARVRDLFP
jgi:uncharacterized membrane protein